MLSAEADHLREQVCNKKDLKNTLWQEIVGLVKRREDLQTDEVPDNKSSGTAGNSEDNDKWVLDETDRVIKRELPHLDDAERFAHKFVDEYLVPRFATKLWKENVCNLPSTEPSDAEGCLSSVVFVSLRSRCLSECCHTKRSVHCLSV